MKQTIDIHEFKRQFKQTRPDSFSERALDKLFNYFEEIEDETGEQFELDVIAICCEFSEDQLDDVLKSYNLESIDDLLEETMAIEIDDSTIVYQNY